MAAARLLISTLVLLSLPLRPGVFAARVLPEAPAAFFNDYAGLMPAERAQALDGKLRRFAEETSSQILVAVFDRLPEDEVVEDFTSATAQAWRVGQKNRDNGAVLFVFVKERKLRIEVGYGLEGALPDALANRIIRESIVPHFRSGDWAGGLEAGAEAMMAATRGEYTAEPRKRGGRRVGSLVVVALIFLFLLYVSSHASRMSVPYGRTYSRRGSSPWIITGGGGGFGGGGGWGGGGGGGGFSGGGGSFGGGGASGDW